MVSMWKGLSGLGLACVLSSQGWGCSVPLREVAEPIELSQARQLAKEQFELLHFRFPTYRRNVLSLRFFPLLLEPLSASDVDAVRAQYEHDLQKHCFDAPGATQMCDIYGLGKEPSAQLVEETFLVVFLQWRLALILTQYQRNLSLLSKRGKDGYSRTVRERAYALALKDVEFYARQGLSDTEAFGFPVVRRSLPHNEWRALEKRLPSRIARFLSTYNRLADAVQMPRGREYYLYQQLLVQRFDR